MVKYGVLSLLLFPLWATGQTQMVVEGLQQPVWVERGQTRLSLYPGQVLSTGDRVMTGNKGKLVLRLAEGSRIKLGVNADFKLETLETQPAGDVLTGFFRVVTGAFRFATAQVEKRRARNVKIALGPTATIGIRGTDVWGKAQEDKDFIVLLEGEIEITRESGQIVVMKTPMTIFDMPRGQDAKPVQPVDQEKLAQWALETELDAHQGVLNEKGAYTVYLYSSVKRELSEKRSTGLQKEGYATDIYEAKINGVLYHRVGITGFASAEDARQFILTAREILGINDAWFTKHRPDS